MQDKRVFIFQWGRISIAFTTDAIRPGLKLKCVVFLYNFIFSTLQLCCTRPERFSQFLPQLTPVVLVLPNPSTLSCRCPLVRWWSSCPKWPTIPRSRALPTQKSWRLVFSGWCPLLLSSDGLVNYQAEYEYIVKRVWDISDIYIHMYCVDMHIDVYIHIAMFMITMKHICI